LRRMQLRLIWMCCCSQKKKNSIRLRVMCTCTRQSNPENEESFLHGIHKKSRLT
jgi:hypothetical protein